jgi:hypothetical protein
MTVSKSADRTIAPADASSSTTGTVFPSPDTRLPNARFMTAGTIAGPPPAHGIPDGLSAVAGDRVRNVRRLERGGFVVGEPNV